MRKHTPCWLIIVSSVILVLMTACGANGVTNTTSTAANGASQQSTMKASGERLYVFDNYASGANQHIIAFQPGDTKRLTLPAGLFVQDHKHIYTATPRNGYTQITVTDTLTGSTIRSFPIPGTYTTAGQNYTTAVLSTDGSWLALREMNQPHSSTTIALIDTQAGKLAKTIQLKGEFDLDALAPAAKRIYLLERLAGPGSNYHIRYYNVQSNTLYEMAVIDKQDLDPNMVGDALTRQVSNDGTFAYTLYTQAHHNIAFVHILSLTGEFFDARCLDLPVGKNPDLLRYYTLTRSANGSTLYAVNAALGTITTIDVHAAAVEDAHIGTTAHFDPGSNVTGNDTTRMLYNGSQLSPDQKTLYVIGLHGIWAFNTRNLHKQANYLPQQVFISIALSTRGQTLYAAYPSSGITTINTSSGQSQPLANSPARSPWGLAWITN